MTPGTSSGFVPSADSPETSHDVRRANLAVALLIGVYIACFTAFSIQRYELYNATGWDFGAFTQLTWNAAHGRFMQNTVVEQNNMLGIHAPYITILIAPLLWLWADPRVLLIAQTVILALGAWPISHLARRHLRVWWTAPAFAALWLLYPALGWLNRWDVHEIAPAATFLAFAFEAADRRAWRQTDIWLILCLLCKEELGLNAAFFGIYMGLRLGRSKRASLAWFIVGMAWFVIHGFVIFPMFRPAANGLPIHAARYTWLLNGNLSTISAYIFSPDSLLKLEFLLKLFGAVLFVSLLAPWPLIVALPTFALSLLSSTQSQFLIYFHYTAPIIPAIMVSAIFGAARLRDWLARRDSRIRLPAITGAMLAAVIVAWLIDNPYFIQPVPWAIYGLEPGAHVAALREVETIIPPEACVVSSNEIQPHYSLRPETYVIGARGDMDGCTYMIVDLDDRRHNDFTDNEQVACSQFWDRKRVPIYYRDTVVVLQWLPADANPDAQRQMGDYCGHFADELRQRASAK